MIINRYNYQEFFLLFTDNELSADEKTAVENFVRQNPDLEEELFILQRSILKPDEEIVFQNKGSLLRFDAKPTDIHPGNFEELAIRYVDNELNNAEKAAIEYFIHTHPGFQQQLDLIQTLKLVPDEHIVFPHKEKLFRYEKEAKPMVFPWWRMAAAAIVLLITGILWLYNQRSAPHGDNITQEIKKTTPGKVETAINNKPENRKNVPAIPKQAQVPSASQAGNLALVNKNKKDNGHRQMTKTASPVISDQSAKNDITGVTPVKIKNPVTGQEKKHQDPVAVQIADEIKEEPENTAINPVKIDPSNEGTAIVTTAAGMKVNAENNKNYANTFQAENTDNNENVFVTNLPVDKKNSLRGIFRKASRFIDKSTSLRASKKSGLLIGNIEIAFQ